MSTRVLIIDAMSNRCIRFQAALDRACYQVEHAETQLDGLSFIKTAPPDIVIIAHDLPGLKIAKFCKVLRNTPQTQMISVLVAVPSENQSARVAALSAGAADVIDFQTPASELQARLRNLTKLRHVTEDIHERNAPIAVGGFAEPKPTFENQIRIAAVCDTGDGSERARALTGMDTNRVTVITIEEAKRGLDRPFDVIVFFEAESPSAMREAMAAVIADGTTRHAAKLYIVAFPRSDHVSPLDLGAQDQAPQSISNTELALRIKRLANRKKFEDDDRETVSTLGKTAFVDTLTGIHNRAYLNKELSKLDRETHSTPKRHAIVMADVDHFKHINDSHGHAASDVVLTHIAKVLRNNLRDGDLLARYGGEEFLIVLTDIGPREARAVADRLRQCVANTPKLLDDKTHVRCTISVGVAHARDFAQCRTADLCRGADSALYRAKTLGRNRTQTAAGTDAFNTASKPNPLSLRNG